MPSLLITGTPGTGKSFYSKRLKDHLEKNGSIVKVLCVNDLIKEFKLYEEYDEEFDTFIICRKNEKILKKKISELINAVDSSTHFLIETHTPSFVPRDLIDNVLVLSCKTDVLFDRLTERGYSSTKREENVTCEIMQIVHEEAHDRFGEDKILKVENNTEEDLQESLEEVMEFLF